MAERMDLHRLLCRGAEDLAAEKPTETRTQHMVREDLGRGQCEASVLKPSPLERPLRAR